MPRTLCSPCRLCRLHSHRITLFDPQVGIDRGVPSGPCEILPFSVRDVLPISLNVSLCQSEVNKEYFVSCFIESSAEVIRFDVPMDKMPVVDILNSSDHLINEHKNRLQGELPESVFEK